MFSKNHVGRPSNEELKQRRIKKALIYGGPALVILIMIVLISSGNLSNLMGNSVTTYYCEDSSYTLSGTKCTKLIKEKARLLGNVNNDEEINVMDVTKILRQYKGVEQLDEFQKAAADINEDGNIDDQDIQIVKSYVQKVNLSENAGSYEIGTKLVCPKDYKLEGEYCTRTLEVDAKKKVEEVKDTYTITFSSGSGTGKMENQVISEGQKLNKNLYTSSNLYFSGWTVRTTKDWKYYCYINSDKTKKDYTDSVKCEKYGYVKIKDEEVMDNDILIDNLTLVAQWEKEAVVEIEPIKAITANIQNGKQYSINDLTKNSPIPNNTTITFKLKFNNHGSQKDFYYKVSKSSSKGSTSGECKKITNKEVTEDLVYKEEEFFNYSQYTTGGLSYYAKEFFTKNAIILGVDIYSDSLCKNNSISYSVYTYKPQRFYIKYDLNGGHFINEEKLYHYVDIKEGLESHLYNVESRLQKLYSVDDSFQEKNYYLNIYKEGYDIEGFRVKNSDGKYICYDSKKENQGFTDESECKKYGYVLYHPYNIISRTTNKDEEVLTFIAQWSKEKFSIDYYMYSILNNGKQKQKLITENNFKRTQIVTKGKKQKLNKLSSPSNSFGGWRVKSREGSKYYCYTNDSKTKKDYVDESVCDNYGYFVLSNGEEIPDEILTRGISLVPTSIRSIAEVATLKIEKATTTNVQNNSVSSDTNVGDKKVFPNNTKLDFYSKVRFGGNSNLYYTIETKTPRVDGKKTACKKLPLDGVLRTSLTILPYQKYYQGRSDLRDYNGGYQYNSSSDYYRVAVHIYTDSACKSFPLTSKYSPEYRIQTFNIHYDSNGGSKYVTDKVVKIYNYVNPLDVLITGEYDRNSSLGIHRDGYELVGFKAKNSKNNYICYKNAQKTSQGFTDSATCNKYGYVMYTVRNHLSRTSGTDGETITFVAQWMKNPVVVNISKLGETYLTKGTKVTSSVRFTVNDKINTYYYKWGYYKDGYANRKNTIENYTSANAFLNYADPYKKGSPAQISMSYGIRWHIDDADNKTCRKITSDTKFNPVLTMNRYVNAGMIMVFKDSECKKTIDTEKDVHKFTEIFFCKNCND